MFIPRVHSHNKTCNCGPCPKLVIFHSFIASFSEKYIMHKGLVSTKYFSRLSFAISPTAPTLLSAPLLLQPQ